MHLLAAQSGVIDDGGEAVDLGQEPGDIVVISAADSELAALARAHDAWVQMHRACVWPISWRSGTTSRSMSISTARCAMPGWSCCASWAGRPTGPTAWNSWRNARATTPLCSRSCRATASPIPALARHSTLDAAACEALHRYLAEGGPENARHALAFCRSLLEGGDPPPPARPLLKAGLYWPGLETPSIDDLQSRWSAEAPVAAITFYRALIEGGNLAPVDELIEALSRVGVNALPIFVSSLKDPVSAATIAEQFRLAPPDIVINATGFAVSAFGAAAADNPLSATGCPVLQAVFAGSAREAWQGDAQGFPPGTSP